jgi:deoxyribonuclease V
VSANLTRSMDAFTDEQRRLAARVVRDDDAPLDALRLVAGADVAFEGDRARVAVVVMRRPDLAVVDEVVLERPVAAPYVPGAFAARELPPLVEALAALKVRPDVVLCDGHGIAHPRRCGLASHLGVTLDLRTIGCAKTLLVGAHGALPRPRGATSELIDENEVVGAAVRTSAGVKPVYVSIGHRVSLATAIGVVLACAPRFRIPEPLRRADHLSKRG